MHLFRAASKTKRWRFCRNHKGNLLAFPKKENGKQPQMPLKKSYAWGCFYVNGCKPAGTLGLSERKGRTDRGRSRSARELHRHSKRMILFHRFCMFSPFCGISETALNKTVSLSGLMSLPAEVCVWREAFIRALQPPTCSLPTSQPHINNPQCLCLQNVCVFVQVGFGGPELFRSVPDSTDLRKVISSARFVLNMYDRFPPK